MELKLKGGHNYYVFNLKGGDRMLFVCTGCWKPEKDADLWKRLAERKVPLPEDVKILSEYYLLLGQHKIMLVVDAPDETAIAKSALNWGDVGEVEYVPAISTRDYMKLRSELLK